MTNNLLKHLILSSIEDNPEQLLKRNIEGPVADYTGQHHKTSREVQLDNIFAKLTAKELDELSYFNILNHQPIPDEKLKNDSHLFRHWEETYPSTKNDGAKTGDYLDTFKKHVKLITGLEFSHFEERSKSDAYKVATLCRRLSLLLQRGLTLLAFNEKESAIETDFYIPNKTFLEEPRLDNYYLSELLTELIYTKDVHIKIFLKNLVDYIDTLTSRLYALDTLSKSITDILKERNEKVDPLSIHLYKSWVINQRKSYNKANNKIYSIVKDFKPNDEPVNSISDEAKALWNYYITDYLINGYKEANTAFEHIYNVMAYKHNSKHYLPKIQQGINWVESNKIPVKSYVRGTKNQRKNLIKSLKSFSQLNPHIINEEKGKGICTDIDYAPIDIVNHDEHWIIAASIRPMNFSSIPELHIKFWDRIIAKAILGDEFADLDSPLFLRYMKVDNLVEQWVKGNDIYNIASGIERINKILNPALNSKTTATSQSSKKNTHYKNYDEPEDYKEKTGRSLVMSFKVDIAYIEEEHPDEVSFLKRYSRISQ